MKHLLATISCLLALNLAAQEVVVEYPYNPDFENDGNVGIEDLLQLLSSFGMGFEIDELTINEVVLSEWLQTISETLIAQQNMIDSLMSIEASSGIDQLDSALIADMINDVGFASASFGERVVLKEYQNYPSSELEAWFGEIPLSPSYHYGEFDFDTDGILHLTVNHWANFEIAIVPDSIIPEVLTHGEIMSSQIQEFYFTSNFSIALKRDEKLVFVSDDPDEHNEIMYASWLPLEPLPEPEPEASGDESVQVSVESMVVNSIFAEQDEALSWQAHSHFTIDESIDNFVLNSPQLSLSGYQLDAVAQIHVHLYLPINDVFKQFLILLDGLSFCDSGYQLEIYVHIDGGDYFYHEFSGIQPCMMSHDNRFKWSYYRIGEKWFPE